MDGLGTCIRNGLIYQPRMSNTETQWPEHCLDPTLLPQCSATGLFSRRHKKYKRDGPSFFNWECSYCRHTILSLGMQNTFSPTIKPIGFNHLSLWTKSLHLSSQKFIYGSYGCASCHPNLAKNVIKLAKLGLLSLINRKVKKAAHTSLVKATMQLSAVWICLSTFSTKSPKPSMRNKESLHILLALCHCFYEVSQTTWKDTRKTSCTTDTNTASHVLDWCYRSATFCMFLWNLRALAPLVPQILSFLPWAKPSLPQQSRCLATRRSSA